MKDYIEVSEIVLERHVSFLHCFLTHDVGYLSLCFSVFFVVEGKCLDGDDSELFVLFLALRRLVFVEFEEMLHLLFR